MIGVVILISIMFIVVVCTIIVCHYQEKYNSLLLWQKCRITDDQIIKNYNENKVKSNFPLGAKIITISPNRNYEIGIIKEYVHITQANNLVCVATINGEDVYVLSHIIPYSDEACKILDKLTPDEQWNITVPHNVTKNI